MARKNMKGSIICPGCSMSMGQCKCSGSNWCWTLYGVLVVVLGLLFILPVGWFVEPWNTVGVFVLFYGVKKVWKSFACR